MSAPVIFNRRLRRDETGTWLDLVGQATEHGCADRSLALSYLGLPDTIAFVSSINDEMIGGTAIYQDKNRLGMVLSSVAVLRKFRGTSAFHIIKTSLPFLRSVAIRDVDALVADRPQRTGIGFPASLALDSWTMRTLASMDFEPIGTMWSYVFECNESNTVEPNETKWDKEPNMEGAKQLIWAQREAIGQSNSLVWSAFDFACSRKTLKTYSINGVARIATSIERLNDTTVVGPIVVGPDCSESSAVNYIVSELCREQTMKVHLPLVSGELANLVESLADRLGASPKKQALTLLRKHL